MLKKRKKKATELYTEKQIGSNLRKEYVKAVYCYLAFLTYTEYIMGNARLGESQDRIKFARRNINNLRHADDITLMAEIKEKL